MVSICFVLGYSILSCVLSHLLEISDLVYLSFLPGMIPIDSKPPPVSPWRQGITTLVLLDMTKCRIFPPDPPIKK